MAKNASPVTAIVSENIQLVIDTYADAKAINEASKAVMDKNKPMIVGAAVETYNAHCAEGVKSVNMASANHVAQVVFAASFALKTNVPEFAIAQKCACIEVQESICINAEKAAEVYAFLESIGHGDWLVKTKTPSFNRAIFDEIEKTPTYAGRAELLACLEEKSIPTLKILK